MATGGTNQPPAADMMELQWDDELARVAQARADSCEFGHECRQVVLISFETFLIIRLKLRFSIFISGTVDVWPGSKLVRTYSGHVTIVWRFRSGDTSSGHSSVK